MKTPTGKTVLLGGLLIAALAVPVVIAYGTPTPHPVLAASTTCDPSVARA